MTRPLHLDAGDPASLDDLLERAAKDLHENMTAGYTDGYERTLAQRALDRYTGGDALDVLATDRLMDLIGVDCLLDETADSSDDVIFRMAAMLVETIRAQGGEATATLFLAERHIVDSAEIERKAADGRFR